MKKNAILSMMAVSVVSLLLASCASDRVDDMANIGAFHKATTSQGKVQLATDAEGKGGAQVDLYIDYSDCMTTATQSEFYTNVQPAIIACNPNYYSIKGQDIKFETNDKMKVHQLLNSITNVDYSNLKGAVDSILKNKHEAILITDGEYYQQGIGANLNNPYLADEFKEWLSQGLDIYVYSEPYQSGAFTKNRYYMLFTDHRIDNNIQQIFSRNAPQSSVVKMVHLYSGIPSAQIAESGVTLNEQLLDDGSGKVFLGQGYEWHILDAKWDDVYNYIANAEDKKDRVFIKGIKLTVGEEDAYRPEEIEVKTYEISDAYQEFNPKGKQAPELGEELDDFLVVDESGWKKGEVVLKFDKEFNGEGLDGSAGNLLRIDICVKHSKENFTGNPNIGDKFKFNSPYGLNTSVYESLKQTLLDPSISPEQRGNPVIYSIYLSTYKR
ncbi:MAG: hypothetical protein IJ710_05720 [Prevotella sp.]|nr:hypothetical protein [Prevotella sp.]